MLTCREKQYPLYLKKLLGRTFEMLMLPNKFHEIEESQTFNSNIYIQRIEHIDFRKVECIRTHVHSCGTNNVQTEIYTGLIQTKMPLVWSSV